MRIVRFLMLVALLAGLSGLMPATAGAQDRVEGAGTPTTLGSSVIAAGEKALTFGRLVQDGRVTAVRVQIDRGDCTVQRVVVQYANGQVHFEDRDIVLNERGRRSALIDPRVEGRLIDTIVVHLKDGTCAAGIALEVEGMQTDAARAEAGGKQTSRPTYARRSRGLSPSSPPPGVSVDRPGAAVPTTPTSPMPAQPRSGAPAPAEGATPPSDQPKPYTEVAIYYGTSREVAGKREVDGETTEIYGPNPNRDGKVSLGRAVVTVPNEGRTAGEINRPRLKILSFGREAEDPSRHFMIYRVVALAEAEFKGAALFDKKPQGGRFKDHAFVFVHGFNVSFDDALFRAAQIAFDMDFDGLPFVFSWPSRSTVAGYIIDKDRAIGAKSALRDFVKIVREIMGDKVRNIHFIGHSMGSHPLMDVLADFETVATSGPVLGQVIFAASDVVAENFRDATSRIAKAASGLTLYASNNDWALTVSKLVRLGAPPVGFVPTGGAPFVTAGIDSVDVSALDTSFWARNHSTYADRKPLIDDMTKLFSETTRRLPDQRDPNFRPERLPRDAGQYWRYTKP